MRILALDVGDKRTGVAISDPTGTIATAYDTIITGDKKELGSRVKRICQEHQVDKIIVGYPINMDGSIGDRARQMDDFAEYLRFKTKLEVELVDERMTSVQAAQTIRETGLHLKKQKDKLDRIAAVIILQSYLSGS